MSMSMSGPVKTNSPGSGDKGSPAVLRKIVERSAH
jgi:hypothetical protein